MSDEFTIRGPGIHRVIRTDNEKPFRLWLNQGLQRVNPFEYTGRDPTIVRIIANAGAIASNRTLEELQGFVMLAEWAVQKDLSESGIDPRKLTSATIAIDPLPTILARRKRAFDINSTPDFADATWPEIFAALALTYIAYVILGREEDQESHSFMSNAVDAMSIANQLRLQEEENQEEMSRRGQKGATKRHEKPHFSDSLQSNSHKRATSDPLRTRQRSSMSLTAGGWRQSLGKPSLKKRLLVGYQRTRMPDAT